MANHSSVAAWFSGLVITPNQGSLPQRASSRRSRRTTISKSVQSWGSPSGAAPLGPSNPRRDPWPAAMRMNAHLPFASRESPSSRNAARSAGEGVEARTGDNSGGRGGGAPGPAVRCMEAIFRQSCFARVSKKSERTGSGMRSRWPTTWGWPHSSRRCTRSNSSIIGQRTLKKMRKPRMRQNMDTRWKRQMILELASVRRR